MFEHFGYLKRLMSKCTVVMIVFVAAVLAITELIVMEYTIPC